MNADFKSKFARKYADLSNGIKDVVERYIQDVKNASFPAVKESY